MLNQRIVQESDIKLTTPLLDVIPIIITQVIVDNEAIPKNEHYWARVHRVLRIVELAIRCILIAPAVSLWPLIFLSQSHIKEGISTVFAAYGLVLVYCHSLYYRVNRVYLSAI